MYLPLQRMTYPVDIKMTIPHPTTYHQLTQSIPNFDSLDPNPRGNRALTHSCYP